MKKNIILFICISMICTAEIFNQTIVSAEPSASPTVVFDGETMTFDSQPYIADGRTMVPMRAIFEKAGAVINWDGDTNTVIAVKGNENPVCVTLQIGTETAFVNSTEIKLDKTAEIINNRTMVPLRFVMESLGADVTWDPQTNIVNIVTE